MTRTTLPAALLVGVLGAAGTACSGSSHNASTATVCQRLHNDLGATPAPAQDISQAKSQANAMADKLEKDTSDAKDATLRSAGQTAATGIQHAVNALPTATPSSASGAVSSAQQALAGLQQALSAARQVQAKCPGS